jgi:hypothetical protein
MLVLKILRVKEMAEREGYRHVKDIHVRLDVGWKALHLQESVWMRVKPCPGPREDPVLDSLWRDCVRRSSTALTLTHSGPGPAQHWPFDHSRPGQRGAEQAVGYRRHSRRQRERRRGARAANAAAAAAGGNRGLRVDGQRRTGGGGRERAGGGGGGGGYGGGEGYGACSRGARRVLLRRSSAARAPADAAAVVRRGEGYRSLDRGGEGKGIRRGHCVGIVCGHRGLLCVFGGAGLLGLGDFSARS